MNPFSVVSHIQSNLPSLPTALLQRRKSAVVNVVVQSSPPTKPSPSTTTTSTSTTIRTQPLPPHAPTTTTTTTTTIIEDQKEEQDLTELSSASTVPAATVPNKPRNNPQAIIGNFDGATKAAIESTNVNFSTDLGSKNLNRHSIHIMPVSTLSPSPPDAEEKNLQRIALRRHTSFPTPTVQSSPTNDNNDLPERAASLDGYDRAKVLMSSPSDAVQATTMISQPRPSHLRHTRSASLPHSLVAPAQPPRSPATVPTPHAPASLLSNIPTVDRPMAESGDDSGEDSENSEDSEEDSEEDGAEEHPEDQDQSSQPQSQFASVNDLAAAVAAPALAASTLGKEAYIVTPPVSPSLNAAATAAKAPTVPVPAPTPIAIASALPSPPTSSPPSPSPRKTMFTFTTPAPIMIVSHQNSSSIPPSSPIHSVTYVSPTTSSTTTTSKTTTTTTTTTTATASPLAAPAPSPISIATPSTPSTPSASTPVTTAAAAAPPASSPSTASSFLSAWQGRSRAMIPTIPRPSPLMPFRAARKVVSSVTTAGTGLLPTKEQLNSIPVAGRILSHPVMDSTLSYIAEKASERGIDLHALTGGIDPKKLIRPEDVPYRKLNKTMIHQAMTLSVLAVQKEELSKAMDDEDGDDAFELYLAAVNTLLHSLPFETCDPLRREAFETQLRSFLDDQLCQKDDGYLSETGSTSKKLRRRRRRRHRQYHDQATSLIHQHTQETATEPTTSQGHQRRQQIRQKNLQREQHIKQKQLMIQQQALEKQQQQEQKEKRRQDKKIAAAMAAAAASQKQQPGKASSPAVQDHSGAKKSKRSSHSRRRQGAAQYAHQHNHQGYDNQNNNNSGGGLGDTIISTAVHSAIRLKQSPIPDTIFHKVDERFHLQDKAWELSKNSIEKAIELDEQYAIHEVVTETVFATLTGLVKAGIAYKESPSYAAVRAAASENSKIAAAPPVQVLESASSSRSHHPQGAQPSSKKSKSKKAADTFKEKEKSAAAAATAAAARSSITSRWTRRPQSVVVESEASDSEDYSDDSDSDSDSDSEDEQQKKNYKSKFASSSSSTSSSSSAFSSASSSCSSTAGSGAENDSDSDNETVELNHETLRPSATSRGGYNHSDTSKLPPPPPYSEQVREKIDMFMALKGAASLLVGSL
ncbi:hypothetical protein BG015_004892 [Linnemannia schmuckeri]|uniref:Uncharacterized protein n=1 Tax=Linnemannia schmuckeri TaxID=64567 RepID=A0A9P5UYI8_9FUNG|nr:hypothetical protein BG015_004892 [Linnemannia schmuckeri]